MVEYPDVFCVECGTTLSEAFWDKDYTGRRDVIDWQPPSVVPVDDVGIDDLVDLMLCCDRTEDACDCPTPLLPTAVYAVLNDATFYAEDAAEAPEAADAVRCSECWHFEEPSCPSLRVAVIAFVEGRSFDPIVPCDQYRDANLFRRRFRLGDE